MMDTKTNHWMRWSAALFALVLTMNSLSGALAAPAAYTFSAKGRIASPESYTLIAPMGGQVQDFTWKPGDAVAVANEALRLTPTQLFATCEGVIRGLQAQVGDQAGQIVAQYGALCSLERDEIRYVSAPTSSAYDKAENRDVRMADVLRVRQGSGDSEETGTGTVVGIEKGSFLLEMERGEFDLEETVTLYKATGDTFADKDKVGKGKVARPPLLPVVGEGVIAEVLVTEGQRVTRGQPLFTLDSASARYSEAPTNLMTFARAGAIQEVLVRPGQFVAQGQAVMTVAATDTLEAVLDVDELDIAKVTVGQKVRVCVDAYPEHEMLATVKEIMLQGTEVLDTTKFHVKVTFSDSTGLLIGMHVTGYWD